MVRRHKRTLLIVLRTPIDIRNDGFLANGDRHFAPGAEEVTWLERA